MNGNANGGVFMDADMETVDVIYRFLTAYKEESVRNAVRLWSLERTGAKKDFFNQQKELMKRGRWEEFPGTINEIPSGHEWTQLGRKIFIRSISNKNQAEIDILDRIHELEDKANESFATENKSHGTKGKPKSDLSMQQTDKLCIHCGGAMVYEPICSGCRLGRIGFRGRFVCMEDMDHEFYVLREGIILPNQGD